MRPLFLLIGAMALLSGPATAGPYGGEQQAGSVLVGQPTGSSGGRASWNRPWEYDSGSGNDRRPELPYYQQGRGQQTGGPARNLLPDDGLQLFPQ